MNKKFRVLSIDGGGLRGIVPLMILKRIEEMSGKQIYELFDLIVGTSTGGIIACGLTATKDGETPFLTVDKLIELYTTKGKNIFPKKENLLTKFNSLINPKFSDKGLDKELKEYFEDITLSQTLKPIIVTSYDINNNEPLIFKSRKSVEVGYDIKLKDVCRATSAAPTYLPSYELNYAGKKRICIDGGVYVNNPVMVAISDIIRNKYGVEGIQLSDITVLSLGTGVYTENLGIKKTPSWGLLNWAKPITDLMMQAVSKSVHYECNELLNNYLRLQIDIDKKEMSDMADSSLETNIYIKEKVNSKILNNPEEMYKLQEFFKQNIQN
jgi:patatin-like phospholipase/acyl hydrolase